MRGWKLGAVSSHGSDKQKTVSKGKPQPNFKPLYLSIRYRSRPSNLVSLTLVLVMVIYYFHLFIRISILMRGYG
jgi:hypothetical protein